MNTCNCKKCRKERREQRLEDPDDCPYEEGTDGQGSWFDGVYDLSTEINGDEGECLN